MPVCEIVQGFRFEAAHFLPNVVPGHRCRRIHGHSYKVEVQVAGEVDPQSGWVIDFYDIEAAFTPVMEALDHHLLNEIPGLENPTAENIAIWIYKALAPGCPALSAVVVHETEHSRAIYRGA
jgi:6-pyruvoyltetrahydropterin/6-carboxytetrahydropterin synthase